jgi:hypothetical protein
MKLNTRRKGRLAAMITVCIMTVSMIAQAGMAGGWEELTRDKGVVVTQKVVDGLDLPIIRGVGIVRANIYDVLAVLNDFDRGEEWMHDTEESKILKRSSELELLTYIRVDTPIPLDDRDVVVSAKITPDYDKKTVRISFKAVRSPLQGKVGGVVRMPMLKGFYLLEKVNDTTTRVTYQAQADVGGMVPDWLVELSSEDIPLNTILNLRKQVKKTAGSYKGFLKTWDPRQGGKGF